MSTALIGLTIIGSMLTGVVVAGIVWSYLIAGAFARIVTRY